MDAPSQLAVAGRSVRHGVRAPRAQPRCKEQGPTRVAITPTQSSVHKVRLRPAYVTSQVDHYRVSSVCPRMISFRRRMVRHSYMSVCGVRLFVPIHPERWPCRRLVLAHGPDRLRHRPAANSNHLLQTSRTIPKSAVGMQGPSPVAADRPGSGTGPRQTPTCNLPSTCSLCLLAMSLAAPASGALPPSRW